MSEEQSGTPTEQVEHVSIGDNGVITLSPEAEAALAGEEMSAEATQLATDAKPAEVTSEGRKIKWNGQEVEVKPDQEIELLQKGYNYDQKMAQLEAERAKLTAYNGLVSAIEASPEIRSKVSQALGYQAEAPKNETPTFDDPIEQLKWEVRQETLREVEAKFIQPMQQQSQQALHQQTLNNVRQQVQADPMYAAVQAEILNQVKAMPTSISQNMYRQLDQDPQAYVEMFNNVKARLAQTKTTSSDTTQLPTELPQPSKRETKAPLLESGNNAPDMEAQKAQKDHIKALERKAKDGDFRAIGELFELMA